MKTSELTGAALDGAVAKAEGVLYPKGDVRLLDGKLFTIEPGDHETPDAWRKYDPSCDWSQGGPIIERERIQLHIDGNGNNFAVVWVKDIGYGPRIDGPTPLIAAMRCLVASRLGDTVEVPGELL